MASTRARLSALGIAAMLFTSACSGGFGGASQTPAASASAATAAPSATAAAATAAPSEAAAPVKLTYLIGEPDVIQKRAHGLADAYTALNPNVTFEFETAPGGADGDNLVKTRLATGEMSDIFWYNSGSLLQALNPADTLVDLSGEPFIANIQEAYLPTVSQNGKIFGVPSEDAGAGGILYSKKIYSDLGLSVPKTWDEFAANNEKIKAAGIAPLAASFADTWTSQILVLADYCNVAAAAPDFTADFTKNEAHFADTPAAAAGFQHLEDGFKSGWWQKDYGAAKFPDALQLLIDGKVAQYPMLSFAVGTIASMDAKAVDDIGFFGIPGADATKNCATIWMPSATYISKTSKNIDEAKKFLAFIASVDGANAEAKALAPSGPFMIKGAKLPDDVAPAVKDIGAYVENGTGSPALEFLSPVKGPSLEQITVAVGSGLNSAQEGAALYDQDVEKQAKQLGLPGW